jgi:hypothetical protein
LTNSLATVHASRGQTARRRSISGTDLSIAIDRSGHTVKGLARCSGLSEAKIRAIQDGRHGLTLEALEAMPPEVRDPLVAEFGKRVGLEIFKPIQSRGSFLSAVKRILAQAAKLQSLLFSPDSEPGSGSGKLQAALWDIAQRGVLTRSEAEVIRPLMREIRQSAAAIESLCDAAEREGVVGLPAEESR